MGGVLAAWSVLLTAENLLVTTREGPEALAATELHVVPLALAASIPLAAFAVLVGRAIGKRKAALVAGGAGLAGLIVAFGVSSGPRMASLALRVPFIVAVSTSAFGLAYVFVRRAPLARPRLLGALGGSVAALAWLADAFVLKGLYPAFHAGLLGFVFAGAASTWLALRAARARFVSLGGVTAAVLSCAWSPGALRKIAGDEHLRTALVERAPILARTVVLSMRMAPKAPPAPANEGDVTILSLLRFAEEPRSLDWLNRDILLVTVDALRADHLGSYGYGRRTSPNLDALAARGVRFEHAYSPMPRTGYSMSSLMTGTHTHALLGAGFEDIHRVETLASLLGRIGYETAGFYPGVAFHEHHFGPMRESGLGFTHHRESSAEGKERRDEVAAYLAGVAPDKPMFVWLHVFEPHDPYVMHPEFPFPGNRQIDAYDSEIAAADASIAETLALFEARRGAPVLIVTADHGESFGEHDLSQHGTSVYEEQVRVPLIIVTPGLSPAVISEPVQVIDLTATLLSALGLPRAPMLRGRDLGPLLAPRGDASGAVQTRGRGFAFSATDDQTMVAQGSERLVCTRKVDACALYDLTTDPAQERPLRDRPERAVFLKRLTAAAERENGRAADSERRSRTGGRTSEADVAELTRRWEEAFGPDAHARGDLDSGREILTRLGDLRAREAVPLLTRSLDDVALRGYVVQALMKIGDPRAIPALLASLEKERYADHRYWHCQALLVLGAREELRIPLSRFAVAPEPMVDAIQFAELAGILTENAGGLVRVPASESVDAVLRVPGSGPARLLVRADAGGGGLVARVDGKTLEMEPNFANLWTARIPKAPKVDGSVRVEVSATAGVRAIWIVRMPEAGVDAGQTSAE